MKTLPDLHKEAIRVKNFRRLKHDGGRAWIKDSQLFEARKDGNPEFTVSVPSLTQEEASKPKQIA
jgi:hypothetical protein